MNTQMPEIEIEGTIFQFDIDRIQLIEKANPHNTIYFNYMTDYGTHYEFDYSPRSKNYSFINIRNDLGDLLDDLFDGKLKEENEVPLVRVIIPRIGELDPEGMCRKYQCTQEDISIKTDFEIIVDQEAYQKRLAGEAVKVDIVGRFYEVDTINNILRSLDPTIKDVNLGLDYYDSYDDTIETYNLYCDMHTGQVVNPMRNRNSKDLIQFDLPSLYDLDPIGAINAYHFKSELGLLYYDLKMSHTIEPLSQTIDANSLLNKDLQIANPDLRTTICVNHNPDITTHDYKGYHIFCHNSGMLAVVYPEDWSGKNIHILLSEKGSDNLTEVKRKIDDLLNPTIKPDAKTERNFYQINDYIKLKKASYSQIYNPAKKQNSERRNNKIKKGPRL